MDVDWLTSDEGRAAVMALRGVDPLKARALLPGLPAPLIADALTQAQHRPEGFPLPLVTIDGIQQSTPLDVAVRRARRLADAGVRTVIDAGCGIGTDSWAFAGAGMHVIAYEVDPDTAQVARTNLEELDVEVHQGDATLADFPRDVALYVDPARRRDQRDTQGRPLRIHDPEQWRPAWSWVLGQAQQRPVVARIRPGHRDLPPGTEWHCTSVNRSLLDATAWFPPLALAPRRATVLHGGTWHEIVGSPAPTEAAEVGRFIVDPDPAIVRSGLVSNAAELIGGHLLDTRLAFITCRDRPPAWVGRGMEVLEQTALKRIAATCRRHGIESATVWARGFDTVPRTGLREGRQGIVVAARVGDERRTTVWVGRPL